MQLSHFRSYFVDIFAFRYLRFRQRIFMCKASPSTNEGQSAALLIELLAK